MPGLAVLRTNRCRCPYRRSEPCPLAGKVKYIGLSEAKRLNISIAQLALAWLLAQGDDITLIPGTRHEKYLLQNWQAMEIELTDKIITELTNQSGKFEVQGTRY